MNKDSINECTSEILKILEATIENISESRVWGHAFTMGTFPNFDEMGLISKAIENPRLHALADQILSEFPPALTGSEQSEQIRASFLHSIVVAASYPDLFKRKLTPEVIGSMIIDAIEGYFTVLTVTFGPIDKFDLGDCTIFPEAYIDNFWFIEQVPWGTRIPAWHSHAIILKQDRRSRATITDDVQCNEEPTMQVVQAIRLAAESEVHAIGSIQKGLVFNPVFNQTHGSVFGNRTRWWMPPYINYRIGCAAFTDLHLEEAKYFASILKSENSPLGVALNRYDMAMKRNNAKDRLVDLAIAAESLFLKSSEKEVLTYRLKMRAARLFASPDKRTETSKWISFIYSLRSEVVHGDRESEDKKIKKIITDEKLLSEEVYNFAEFIRQSIRLCSRIIEAGENNLPQFFDQLLLGISESEQLVSSISLPELPKHPLGEVDFNPNFINPPVILAFPE